MRRHRTAVLVPVLLAALVACGERARIAAGDVGAVCPPPSGETHFTLSDYLVPEHSTPTWQRVRRRGQLTRGETVAGDTAIQRVSLDAPEHVAGPAAVSASRMLVRAAEEAESELDRGSAVVLVSHQDQLTRAIASVRDDGSVVFLGECAREEFTTPFVAFVEARHKAGDGRSAADLLYALPKEPALAADLRRVTDPADAPAPTWADVAPERRVIDPDGELPPPATVMADLRAHLVHFAFPAEWRGFEGSLVTFVPGVGWNVAVPFGVRGDDPAVPAYVSLTKPLELWVVPSPGDIRKPLARLAVFAPQSLSAREDVYLRARVKAASLDDLVRQANAGTEAFELRP